ncbi:MAG: DUF433 domain-containing protein [Caldilineaceae bacterium]|nr:DUF433 domain-containing protein [Caldilineaceae bacterium]
MARYSLNWPAQLKQEAEAFAHEQGISLNQFILWSVSEKVGGLKQSLDDPRYPQITYRRGSSGIPQPTIRGTGIRVQTVVVAAQQWRMAPDEIAEAYSLRPGQVQQALAFYGAHRQEIDVAIAAEEEAEEKFVRPDAQTAPAPILCSV